MPQLQGTDFERRFVPLTPCPDGAPHFHLMPDAVERYADWDYRDMLADPQTNSVWMFASRIREGEK